jgi:hypothetical protein
MLGRTLRLAAVTLFIGTFAVFAVRAQAQNLEAGKSPSQLFAGTCNACHKTPRGLLKTVSAGSLPGFLRQHYTTSGDMAAQLSSFLIANGASDGRLRQGPDAKPAAVTDQVDRQGRRLRAGSPQEAARPEADGAPLQDRRRLARPEAVDPARPAADGQAVPAQAGSDRGADGRKLSTKQRLSRPARPGSEEVPSAKEEPQKLEPAIDDKARPETAIEEIGKPEAPKPSDEGKAEAARMETPKGSGGEKPLLRAEPVPPVTPAPPGASSAPTAAASGGSAEPAPADRSAAAPGGAARPAAPASSEPPTAAVTASAPPPALAGPPAPPISQ